ncbi:MAG TPA: thioesterase family protein [Acidimicrobiales bacterium]
MHPLDLSFDAAIASELEADGRTFRTNIHPQWTVGDKPNGGYLMAMLGRAAREIGNDAGAHDWDVVSGSITYLRPPDLRAAEIRTDVLRLGRTATQVRTVLVQDDAELVDAVFVVGELPAAGSPVRYDDTAPLDAPGPEDCIKLPPLMPGGVPVGIMEVLDLRLDPSSLPSADTAARPGTPLAELRGWSKFADGREPDALSLLWFIDAIPPATFRLGSSGWVPTLQMSAYVRGVPAPGWLGIRLTAHHVSGGMVDESCTVWDSSGRVVAQATQLARLRFATEQR